jgi:hypothetical protein
MTGSFPFLRSILARLRAGGCGSGGPDRLARRLEGEAGRGGAVQPQALGP